MLSVVIPVGPFEADKRYLGECLESIKAQTVKPSHVQFVFDACEVDYAWVRRTLGTAKFDAYTTPWRVGYADAWNFGVAYSGQPLNLLMRSNDWLEPGCIEALRATYDRVGDDLGYYHLDVSSVSAGGVQEGPDNAAMVTRKLWRLVGGFPLEAGLGAPHTLLTDIILGNSGRAGNLHRVAGGALYNVRVHDGQDTRCAAYQRVLADVRRLVADSWKPAEWVRGG